MHQASEYTLSLRSEAASVDFDAMDKAMGVVGTRQHVDRQPTRFRPGHNYDRWEIEARDVGATTFESIDEAFSAMGGGNLAWVVGNAATTQDRKTYWWCGCFHTAPSVLTLITEGTLDLLGRSCSPIFLNTFYSSGASGDSWSPVAEVPDDSGDELSGHRYRFRLSDGELCLSEGEWGPYFEEFSEGIELKMRELAKPIRRNDLAGGSVKRIECEHVQYAYDGGPTLSAAHAGAIALLGLDVAILWRKGR